jgi:4'-phosphopantetheinyl transferase
VALAKRFLPPEEVAAVAGAAGPDSAAGARAMYHRLLSRKEACVKASGGRLLDGLGLPVLRAGTVVGAGRFTGERWALRDLPAPPGFVAALATLGGGDRGVTDEVRLFEWAGWESAHANRNCRCSAQPTAEWSDAGHIAWNDRRSRAHPLDRGE